MHKSNFHVIGFSYVSITRNAMGRVFRNRADFDVAATIASNWILAVTASKWILAAIALVGHQCQSSSTPPPPLGHRY
jgi:hypothetical protein